MNNRKIRNILIIFLFTILIFAFAFVPKVKALQSNETINSTEGFKTFITDFNSGTVYSDNVEVTLALQQSTFEVPTPLGTESHPFGGTIKINVGNANVFYATSALFGYITSDAKIVDNSDNPREIIIIRTENNTVCPLFANHVVQGTNNQGTTWKIKANKDDSDQSNVDARDFEGVIGEIGAGCVVEVDFTHDSNRQYVDAQSNVLYDIAKATSTGNVGMICNSLGANAQLTAKVSATMDYVVESTGGVAGGLVGTMGAGSTLIVDCGSLNSEEVIATGASQNAGGLVGSMANGAQIVFNEDFTCVGKVTATDNSGALVGYAVNGIIDGATHSATITLAGTITGNSAAGGAFGEYNSTGSDKNFDLTQYESTTGDLILKSPKYQGGIFGSLTTSTNITIDGNITHNQSNKADFARGLTFGQACSGGGGLIGKYKSNSLSLTLLIQNNKVELAASNDTSTAGAIGKIDTADSAAYVKIQDYVVKADNTIGSGLIYDGGNKGNFIDIAGLISVSGTFKTGLIYIVREGVVRITGTTDLSGNYSGTHATTNSAQLIYERNNALVYSIGDGTSSSTWKFYRAANATRYDDIGDWGEVVRGFAESDIVTVSGHVVTLKAPVLTMATSLDFALTALNICHNDNGSTGHEALRFAENTNKRSKLLESTLSISASVSQIDISGTGITGLTRDDGSLGAFTGTFDGNNKTLLLNIGEDYSANNVTTTKTSSSRGAGVIMRHAYIGLFAKTNGATIQNVTIGGTITYVSAISDGKRINYIGSVTASNTGSLTISNVTIANDIYYYKCSSSTAYVGGLIGNIASASGTVNIDNTTLGAHIAVCVSNATGRPQVSGGIGYVNQHSSLTINIGHTTNVTLEGSYIYDSNKSNDKYVEYGGLIASLSPVTNSDNKDGCTINIERLTVDQLSITKLGDTNNRNNGIGGILGYKWLDAVVTIGSKTGNTGLVIGTSGSSGPSLTVDASSSNANVGALVYRATGYWKVNYVKVNKFDITTNVAGTFGFIANESFNYGTTVNEDDVEVVAYNSALYLELFNENYDIANTSITGTFNVFDEVVAYTFVEDTNIEENGQSIISISAKDDSSNYKLYMNGTKTNTYQNKIGYATKYNPNSRYYYNLDTIRVKASPSDAEKLLLWSLNVYAHPAIIAHEYFTNYFSSKVFAGVFDMEGISYYPVIINDSYTFNGSTIAFYNLEIETSENVNSANGNTDNYARTTIYSSAQTKTQHYLMHHSLFLGYQGTLNINGTLILEGTIAYNSQGNYHSGLFISGILGGDANNRATFNCSGSGKITLSGLYVHNLSASNTPVTPLLVYKIETNTGFTLEDIEMANYDDFYDGNTTPAATSLIGDVGSSSATNINLTFSKIALDARITEDSPSISAYSSTKSIFKYATLLNSFAYDSASSGVYNFTYDEDWGSGNRHVTYGYELSETVEFKEDNVSLENIYFASGYYVNPSNNPSDAQYNTAQSFTGFLHYVRTAYNTTNKTHEISVNVASADVTEGCGMYNDPYIIKTGKQLVAIARTIEGSSIDTGFKIKLPYTDNGTSMWCSSETAANAQKDYEYTFNGSNAFTGPYATTNGITQNSLSKNKDVVRAYLASAYYQIDNDIIIPATSSFALGSASDSNDGYSSQFAFRGVIVGKVVNDVCPTITNNSNLPFIKSSNGCVVKNVNIVQNGSVAINQTSNTKFRYDNSGCASFGAVISQVMGGDNIIDHVGVTFGASAQITFTNNKFNRLAPVGGYVGVLLNGALIFRNMSEVNNRSGLTSANCSMLNEDNKDKWLYVNPIIGRVIAGYAFTETSSYKTLNSEVTMDNGVKNYSIPDFDSTNNAPKITVTASSASGHTVTLPNSGQALFLLAALINSGACSAGYNGSTEQAYDSNTTLPWYGYRANTAVRNGTYEYVGTSTNTDYNNNIAGKDIFANGAGTNAKIPYAIRKYTNTDGSMYRIRSICNGDSSGAVATFNFATNGVYNLPASYRGIGSIFYISDKTIMVLKNLNGNNARVNFSTYYEEYDANNGSSITDKYSADSYNTRKNENYGTTNFSGLGLFSHLKQLGVTSDSSTSSVIKDLTLGGSIFFDMRRLSDGGTISYLWRTGDENSVGDDYVMSVGGIAGEVGVESTTNNDPYNSRFRIANITLDGVNFEGPKAVGGIIGFAHRSTDTNQGRVLTNCGTTSSGITITAGVCAGGLIGFILKRYLKVEGDPTNSTNIYVKKICSKGTSTSGTKRWWLEPRHVFTAGGIAGMLDIYDDKNNSSAFCHTYISNYNIIGVYNTSESDYQNDPKIYASTSVSGAGCITGTSKSAMAHIDNIEVRQINLQAAFVGGVYGITLSDKVGAFYNVNNMRIDGQIGDTEYKSYFKGTNVAGGMFGNVEVTQTLSYTVNDCSIRNMTIEGANCAGGFLGRKFQSAVLTAQVNDYAVTDCDIITRYSSVSDNTGTGGLVGDLETATTFTGYNLAVQNCTINRYNGNASTPNNNIKTVAYAVGNNKGALSTIKIAGLSVTGCNTLRKLVSNSSVDDNNDTTTEYFNTNGYIVLSDYNGRAIDVEEAIYEDSFSSLYNSSTDFVAEYPYATVSPQYNIGNSGFVLTGDGISDTKNAYVASNIIVDATNRYLNSKSYINTATGYAGKVSTFNAEQGTNFANDFVVLVIDDFSRESSTNLINAYVNLLANTNGYNYANNLANVYSTNVYKIEYDESTSKFVKRNEEASLKKDNGQFYMINSAVDTAGTMFSLIDVSFYDPSGSGKVAYHLYVPVLVKKMMKFNFEIGALSGTNYDATQYTSRYGVATMENLGSPITLYFKYTYLRTQSEWQTLIEQGEDLLNNYTKSLAVSKPDGAPSLDGGTQLVLVDVNRGGVPYYSTWSNAMSNNKLNLGSFKESLANNAAAFTPCTLCDLLSITASASGSGKFVKLNSSTGATTTATLSGNKEYFRLATAAELADGGVTKYTLTVTNENDPVDRVVKLEEKYYISIFTASSDTNNLYNYAFTSLTSLEDESYRSPCKIEDVSELNDTGNIRLFMGNIFEQNNMSVESKNGNLEISSTNDTLNADISCEVKLKDALYNTVKDLIGGADTTIHIYQSFLFYLVDKSTSKKYITGGPELSGNYEIEAIDNESTVSTISATYTSFNQTNVYIELVNNQSLNDYLVNGGGARISSTIALKYLGDENISEQFPIKEDITSQSIGIYTYATSNIAFDANKTAQSKVLVEANDLSKLYYCYSAGKKAKLYYNPKNDLLHGELSYLGINPLDSEGLTNVKVPTIATYDISTILTEAEDYDLVKCTIELKSKADDYTTNLAIKTYWSNLTVCGDASGYTSLNANSTQAIFTFTRASLQDSVNDSSIAIPITFDVITGEPFESAHLMYGNYRVIVKVELVKESDSSTLNNSIATNYLIYTNARILPDFITIN